jgi:hypothetical protein
MLCDSLKHFSYSEISLNFQTIYIEFEKAVFLLLGILEDAISYDEYKLHVCMRKSCIKIKNKKNYILIHVVYTSLYFFI